MPEEKLDPETMAHRLVYFAAERTLMAWIRSALGLMALGFVIDRFGLVLRTAMPKIGPSLHPKAFSFWVGTVMVLLGALMAIAAALRYWRFSVAYHRQGSTRPRHGLAVGVVFTFLVAVFGFLIAYFLTVTTG